MPTNMKMFTFEKQCLGNIYAHIAEIGDHCIATMMGIWIYVYVGLLPKQGPHFSFDNEMPYFHQFV